MEKEERWRDKDTVGGTDDGREERRMEAEE